MEFSMTDLVDLHKIRQEKGKIRQNRHKSILEKLDDAIKPVESPYKVEDRDREAYYKRLKTIELFYSGSIGYETNAIGSDYIYRITTAYKLAKVFHNNWIFVVSPSDDETEEIFNSAFVAEISERVSQKNLKDDWINLTECAKGNLKYKRNFSFWTNEEYDYNNIVTDCFKVGLATDWFDKLVLVLRCKFSEVNPIDIRVPTAIDAFDQPIFHPRKDNDSIPPKHGTAIYISCDPLTLGKKEFVVGEVPADKIEFKIVEMKDKDSLGIKFSDNNNLWDKLNSYYSTKL